MKEIIASLLAKELKLKKEEILNLIEIPPDESLGDYSFPCFQLAGRLKKNPVDIATELANTIKKTKEISAIEAKGPYLNFFIDKKELAKQVLKKTIKPQKKNLKGMVEFSQPNTHKAFHIGHIRGTSLGESLARIAEFFGEKVVRANYSGDTGMHIAKWIWNYTKNHSKEKLKKDESWIASIYVDAVKRLANDKSEKLQEEVNEINRKIESRSDKKINELWKKTRKLSIDSWKEIYKQLNIKFDKYYFESQLEEKGKQISQELLKKGIAKISDGAVIVDLDKYSLGIWVLLRKDGTVLYSGKDLALAEKKFNDYKIDWSLYVVADAQNLHMQQLFKTLELMNFKQVKKLYHVRYGLVRLPTGKMSSRTGDNILYSDFIKEIKQYAKTEILKREKLGKKELETRAEKIAIAAIKYSMLKQDANKVIVFDKKEALNFEGNTGPYLLYTYARASSILRKAKSARKTKYETPNFQEARLIKKIAVFSEVVEQAYKNLNPSLIANYSFELAQIFNEFYHSSRVIGSKEESFRLALVKAFTITIKQALSLLGIEAIERM